MSEPKTREQIAEMKDRLEECQTRFITAVFVARDAVQMKDTISIEYERLRGEYLAAVDAPAT